MGNPFKFPKRINSMLGKRFWMELFSIQQKKQIGIRN